MKEDFKLEDWDCDYEELCSCGNTMHVLTQGEMGKAEYRTYVGVPCSKCSKLVWFDLPVN